MTKPKFTCVTVWSHMASDAP